MLAPSYKASWGSRFLNGLLYLELGLVPTAIPLNAAPSIPVNPQNHRTAVGAQSQRQTVFIG